MEFLWQETCGIGLMSGTSLDGVDLVFVEFQDLQGFKILKAETIPYPKDWLLQLKNIALYKKGDPELKRLNTALGIYFGDLICDFIMKHQLKNIHWIASHGHTVHHQPEIGYTLQIGCGNEIFKKTGIKKTKKKRNCN